MSALVQLQSGFLSLSLSLSLSLLLSWFPPPRFRFSSQSHYSPFRLSLHSPYTHYHTLFLFPHSSRFDSRSRYSISSHHSLASCSVTSGLVRSQSSPSVASGLAAFHSYCSVRRCVHRQRSGEEVKQARKQVSVSSRTSFLRSQGYQGGWIMCLCCFGF
ncbi:hypothetical protein E2C01_050766 [Portunus trituberculatus]|uniref:Uncharacterized protein n=1 Tax=Portunus trituberculatus TaxID=210409 RepID=A0A5B7GH02_PORTR|nr:hypothetical protein [Portunus trituberculatus]